MVGTLVVEVGAQIVRGCGQSMSFGLRGPGTSTQEIGALAPGPEPRCVVTHSVAKATANAVDLGYFRASVGRSTQDRQHFGRPAIVTWIVSEMFGSVVWRVQKSLLGSEG